MASLLKFMQILEWADWESPPEEMNCSMPFQAIISTITDLMSDIASAEEPLKAIPPPQALVLLDKAIRFYVLIPSVVNVLLNYKICVEHGLPLHPTVYYELKEARKYRISHSLGEIQRANELYWRAIEVARECCHFVPGAAQNLNGLLSDVPPSVSSFVYTAVQDHYTWLGAKPSLLSALAGKIKKGYQPSLLVAAAHGSIMPALVLSELLEVPLYFIRFSMFKRHDEEPIISLSDQAWLFDFRGKNAILYDEDVAGGRTLEFFLRRLSPLFGQVKTACSIRHAGSSIRPDFFGRMWWD
jgi:hypothetical protein